MNKKQLEAKKKYYETFKDSVDYIQVYDNIISEEECKHFMNLHKNLKKEGLGKNGEVSANYKLIKEPLEDTQTTYDDSLKNSYDIYINNIYDYLKKHNRNKEIKMINKLHTTINAYISDYLIKVGLMGTAFIGTSLNAFKAQKKKKYYEFFKSEADTINSMFALKTVCLRKYDKKVGGYHAMHSDISHRTITRCVAGLLYLNTIEDGGETKFPVLGREIKPKQGRLALFPPYYTHMHYGEIAKKDDRYVIVLHIVYNNLEVKINQGE